MQTSNGSISSSTNNNTLVLDVSQSWSDGNSAVFTSVTKGDAGSLNLAHLWAAADQDSLYQFGGIISQLPRVSTPVSLRTLHEFTPSASNRSNGTWIRVPDPEDSIILSLDRPAGALGASGSGKGFMLGGFIHDDAWNLWPTPGFVTYDMATNEWTNQTAQDFSPSGTALLGTMQFLPGFGAEGVLIAFGGQTAGAQKAWRNDGEGLLDMSDIRIYDIARRQWHRQTAAGAAPRAIPNARSLFCSAALHSRAGPNGTAQSEIFVYGGESGNFVYSSRPPTARQASANAALGAVHVLSVPGFVWFRADGGSAPPRTCHTCEVAGRRQVLSIGGLPPIQAALNASTAPDAFPRGLGVFDMSAWQWKPNYDAAAAPYEPADAVRDWYRQNGHVEWSDDATAALFSGNASTQGAAPPSAGAAVSPRVITGAAIGGMVGLLVLLVGWKLYMRRRHKQAKVLLMEKARGAELHGEASQGPELSEEAQVKAELHAKPKPKPELLGDSRYEAELSGDGECEAELRRSTSSMAEAKELASGTRHELP